MTEAHPPPPVPPSILREPDEDARHAAMDELAHDLRTASARVDAVGDR